MAEMMVRFMFIAILVSRLDQRAFAASDGSIHLEQLACRDHGLGGLHVLLEMRGLDVPAVRALVRIHLEEPQV